MKSMIFGAALLAFAGSASATTYLGSPAIPGAAVNLSITTDGATGVLARGDITGWNISIVDSAGMVDLTPANSQVLLQGSDLTATATALSFNFSGSSILLFEAATIGDGGPFYCATTGGCFGENTPSQGVSTVNGENPIEQQAYTGNVVLGTAGAVPEPASWALMLAGFGGLGFAIRTRRNAVAA